MGKKLKFMFLPRVRWNVYCVRAGRKWKTHAFSTPAFRLAAASRATRRAPEKNYYVCPVIQLQDTTTHIKIHPYLRGARPRRRSWSKRADKRRRWDSLYFIATQYTHPRTVRRMIKCTTRFRFRWNKVKTNKKNDDKLAFIMLLPPKKKSNLLCRDKQT